MDTGTGRVQAQLPAGNSHTVDTEVAQAENALAVGHHDNVHLLIGNISEQLVEMSLVLDGKEGAMRVHEDMAVALADFTDCRCVHHRHVLIDVVDEQLVEEILIGSENAIEHQILVERVGETVQNRVHAGNLLLALF